MASRRPGASLRTSPGVIVIGLSFASDPSVQAAMKNAGAYVCVTKERAAEDIYRAIVDAVN